MLWYVHNCAPNPENLPARFQLLFGVSRRYAWTIPGSPQDGILFHQTRPMFMSGPSVGIWSKSPRINLGVCAGLLGSR